MEISLIAFVAVHLKTTSKVSGEVKFISYSFLIKVLFYKITRICSKRMGHSWYLEDGSTVSL